MGNQGSEQSRPCAAPAAGLALQGQQCMAVTFTGLTGKGSPAGSGPSAVTTGQAWWPGQPVRTARQDPGTATVELYSLLSGRGQLPTSVTGQCDHARRPPVRGSLPDLSPCSSSTRAGALSRPVINFSCLWNRNFPIFLTKTCKCHLTSPPVLPSSPISPRCPVSVDAPRASPRPLPAPGRRWDRSPPSAGHKDTHAEQEKSRRFAWAENQSREGCTRPPPHSPRPPASAWRPGGAAAVCHVS